MTFNSFIYKPNPKKIKEDKMSLLYLAGIILLLVLVFIFFLRGLLVLGLFGAIAGGLIKLKIEEIKKKGANRFGSLPSTFTLGSEAILVGSNEFKTEVMTDLRIEADDFAGGPGGDILSSSAGTENFIDFSHQGEGHSYQFVVKKQSDLKLISQIYDEIKKKERVA